MKRFFVFLLYASLLSGCGSIFKSRWDNFTAYYNTYYNAKKSYQEGYDKVISAKVNYNPEQPIRIHEAPVNSGAQDFQKAIDKGAEILRKYPDSKWVDDAVFLIGKSYHFRKDFFSADLKYDELLVATTNNELIQQAIIWKGRLFLDMELYQQGISYLSGQLNDGDIDWKRNNKAEANAILAQLYIENEDYDLAVSRLEDSMKDLGSKAYKERAYFLLGQLYELLGNTEMAFNAYDQVGKHYVEYQLQYLAKRKKAETARSLGNYDIAYSTFDEMIKDDKNTEFKAELDFELAKTLQERGDYEEAEEMYRYILYRSLTRPDNVTAAKTYYGLAEIYRFEYSNFSMAAAYYDTASRQNAPLDQLPATFNADDLAKSFGSYSNIKSEIAHKDSLIWVANLSGPQLDSLVNRIREQKIKELEDQARRREQQQNTLVNITGSTDENEQSAGGNGFLNIKNQELLASGKNQFRAIWGDRPLVDNWRVAELLIVSQANTEGETSENTRAGAVSGTREVEIRVDLSEVPFEKQEQDSLKREIASLKFELGNLFFLSLQMPDSAARYFSDIIENYPEAPEIPVAYYSLSEKNFIEGNDQVARSYALDLISKYPSSRYGIKLAERYNIDLEQQEIRKQEGVLELFREIESDTTLQLVEQAKLKTELALANTKSTESAKVLFDATQDYIQLATQNQNYVEKYSLWAQQKEEWQQNQDSLSKQQEDARIAIQDTSVNQQQLSYFQSIIDSTLEQPDFNLYFPYEGAYWDTARINLDLYLLYFKNTEFAPRVRLLKQELEIPKPKEPEQDLSQQSTGETPEEESGELSELPSCSELQQELMIRGGENTFISSIELSRNQRIALANKEIVYLFVLNTRGGIEEHSLVTELLDPNIEAAIQEAIEENLVFEPVLVNGQAIQVQCEYGFKFAN